MVKHADVPNCEVGQRIVHIARKLQRAGLLGSAEGGTVLVPAREVGQWPGSLRMP